MSSRHSTAEKLCLTCGLCCNGVIFGDVQLQPDENFELLETLGLHLFDLRRAKKNEDPDGSPLKKFSQPCAAFDGCRCRIYADRPKYCRAFECMLLKDVNAGLMKTADALRIIEKARKRAEKVRQLLRKLGDKDENIALGLRFRRAIKRVQRSSIDPQTGAIFSQLTLAVQDLNLLLSEKFYPGSQS